MIYGHSFSHTPVLFMGIPENDHEDSLDYEDLNVPDERDLHGGTLRFAGEFLDRREDSRYQDGSEDFSFNAIRGITQDGAH